MNKQQLLKLLHNNIRKIETEYKIEKLALFGSAVRDEITDQSDIDVYVVFKNKVTLEQYFGLKYYLEELIGLPVDLATHKMIKPSFSKEIQDHLHYVA